MAARPGYIYILRLHTSDNIYECPYKIGQSANPTIRRSQLGIVMSYELSIVKMIRTNDMDNAEMLFHQTFEREHMQGEWYRLDEDGLVFLLRTDEYNVDFDQDLPF